MPNLTHLDEQGRATMVDVGAKAATTRTAVAAGEVRMAPATLAAIREGAAPKGDVLAAARIAGILAAKRTPELIPLCHTLLLTKAAVDFEIDGRIYALLNDGRIVDFYRSAIDATITPQVLPPVSNAVGLSTQPDRPYYYMADEQGRILSLIHISEPTRPY